MKQKAVSTFLICLEKDEEEEAELAAEVSEDSLGSLWDDEDSKVRESSSDAQIRYGFPLGAVPDPTSRSKVDFPIFMPHGVFTSNA
jgi:hypothetical protein